MAGFFGQMIDARVLEEIACAAAYLDQATDKMDEGALSHASRLKSRLSRRLPLAQRLKLSSLCRLERVDYPTLVLRAA